MPERHTLEFKDTAFNFIADESSRKIKLQFIASGVEADAAQRVIAALRSQYSGVIGAVKRWMCKETNPFVLPKQAEALPDAPGVLTYTIAVKPKADFNPSVAELMAAFQKMPGYQRTLGAPLDPDLMKEPCTPPDGNAANAAKRIIKEYVRPPRAGDSLSR